VLNFNEAAVLELLCSHKQQDDYQNKIIQFKKKCREKNRENIQQARKKSQDLSFPLS